LLAQTTILNAFGVNISLQRRSKNDQMIQIDQFGYGESIGDNGKAQTPRQYSEFKGSSPKNLDFDTYKSDLNSENVKNRLPGSELVLKISISTQNMHYSTQK